VPIHYGGTIARNKEGSLLYSTLNTDICIYNLESGSVEKNLELDGEKITCFALDRTEMVLIGCTAAKQMHVYNIAEGKVLRTWKVGCG
jgi:hypothetical protein